MDSFPSDFTFSAVEQKLYNQVSTSEESAKQRLVISNSCKKAIDSKQEFFYVNLKGVQESVKTILIKDLFERFPTIGYISEVPNEMDMFSTFFGWKPSDDPEKIVGSLGQKLPEGKRHILKLEKGTFVNADVYIVPITTNFANKMTSYVV